MSDLTREFSFQMPIRIEYGPGSVRSLAAEVSRVGATKVLVVTDEGVLKAGLGSRIAGLLRDAGIEFEVFDGVEPNPKDLNVEEGAAAARRSGAEALVALGGGSPIDCAKATGVDALTHAIEAYTVNCSEPEARSAMMLGSLLAGIAFSHSDVGSVHCMAEALGGVYDLPHGVCNAILLPHVMEYNMDYCLERYARVARAMGAGPAAADAVSAVKSLCRDVGLPALNTLGIRQSDLDFLAEMSAKNGSTPSNPRPMDKQNYLEVFRRALA